MRYFLFIIFAFTNIFVNAQSGITWNPGIDISNNSNGNMHPRMALDGKGNPLVIWGRMADEAVMFSRWNGMAFTTPVKLNPNWMQIATASWMGPHIASKGDTVYIVARQKPESDDTSKHIYIFSSFNGGISFNKPVQVDFIGNHLSRFPTVTVDDKGNPVVAFMKFNISFIESEWVVTKSNDYGKTFTADVKASGFSDTIAEACDCCPGAIISKGNTSAMIYRDNLKNIRDIWTGISTNNNISFTSGYNADKNKWMINSCPATGPDAVFIGDSIYSVFMSGGNGFYRTYLSKANIDGTSSVTRLTGNITGLGQQNYPRIGSHGNAAAIVWKQNISGTAQLPIMFTNNVKNGFPAYELVDAGEVTNTDVAVSSKNVFVVWQDDKSGTVKYRSGSYVAAVGINENNVPGFSVYPNPASSVITLRTNSANYDVKILNLLGETMLYMNNQKNASAIDVSGLKSGIYFIRIQSGNQNYIQKFIRQ